MHEREIQLLNATIARLQRVGWHKGSLGGEQGPNCVMGALYHADREMNGYLYGHVIRLLERRLQRQNGKFITIEVWNDLSADGVEDVLLLLKETRYELETADES